MGMRRNRFLSRMLKMTAPVPANNRMVLKRWLPSAWMIFDMGVSGTTFSLSFVSSTNPVVAMKLSGEMLAPFPTDFDAAILTQIRGVAEVVSFFMSSIIIASFLPMRIVESAVKISWGAKGGREAMRRLSVAMKLKPLQ